MYSHGNDTQLFTDETAMGTKCTNFPMLIALQLPTHRPSKYIITPSKKKKKSRALMECLIRNEE